MKNNKSFESNLVYRSGKSIVRETIELPDEMLAEYWKKTDWSLAEGLLETYQRQLALAATSRSWREMRYWQRTITASIDIKKLAVRQATQDDPSPGIDRVRWVTDAQKMRGAINLRSDHYKAIPLRQFALYDRNKNKERVFGIPAIRDRAMQVLQSYALFPVAESMADRKSFAFRRGRSQLDAHYYVLEGLNRRNPPEWILIADIKSFYDTIAHSWILDNIPLQRSILKEFLSSGILFQRDDKLNYSRGISLGCSLSPVISNMVLDGLEWKMFSLQNNWYKDRKNVDYSDGNVIRFADDIIITARTEESAALFKKELVSFLSERGLELSEKKTKIIHVSEGFEYLSRYYIKKRGRVYCVPSKKSINRFVDDVSDFIFNAAIPWSQLGLIKALNRKLHGWASYHRISDAKRAFIYVDSAMNAMLLKLMKQYYPHRSIDSLIQQFWYTDIEGRKVFALDRDKSIRLYQLEDTVLITQQKLYTHANPYIHIEYFNSRVMDAEISKVSGKNKAIWNRQEGKCYICKKSMKPEEEKQIILKDLRTGRTQANLAYVHSACMERQFITFHSDQQHTEKVNILELAESLAAARKNKKNNTDNDRLSFFFSQIQKNRFHLKIKQIEEMLGSQLPEIAYILEDFWHERGDGKIPHCWQKHGFSVLRFNMKNKTIVFTRSKKISGKIKLPDKLKGNDLPDVVVYEIHNHFDYIIKKYGL